MELSSARVLLVSDDRRTLERVRDFLVRAGALPNATTSTGGLAAIADRSDVAVLFDDCGEPDDFDTRLAVLTRSKTSLLVVTDRAAFRLDVPTAAVVFTPSGVVRGETLLDAIRARVRAATPELPFTD
jgi:hypothetical protein